MSLVLLVWGGGLLKRALPLFGIKRSFGKIYTFLRLAPI